MHELICPPLFRKLVSYTGPTVTSCVTVQLDFSVPRSRALLQFINWNLHGFAPTKSIPCLFEHELQREREGQQGYLLTSHQ